MAYGFGADDDGAFICVWADANFVAFLSAFSRWPTFPTSALRERLRDAILALSRWASLPTSL